MLAYIAQIKDQVSSELVLHLKAPILHHARAAITRSHVCNSTKTASASAVVLCRIQVRRRRERGNSGIQQNWGRSEMVRRCKAGRGGEPISKGLPEVGVVEP